MTSAKKSKLQTSKKYDEILKFYKALNNNVFKDMFFASIIDAEDMIRNGYTESDEHVDNRRRSPMFISQMGVLYSLCPLKYHGVLNQQLLDFLAYKFRNNVIFIISDDGFLMYIMIMQTNRDERIAVNTFFANHLDDLQHYQYFTSEYDPKLERFKLMKAKTHVNEKVQDIVLTFF
jgi:hypothetical protein